MDKIIALKRKHYIIWTILVSFFLASIITLLIHGLKLLFNLIGNELDTLFHYFCNRTMLIRCWKGLIESCNVTPFGIFNMVFFYFSLYVIAIIIHILLVFLVILLVIFMEECINRLNIVILGEKHQKSLEYNGIVLWFIKFKADTRFFLEWIQFDVVKMRCTVNKNKALIDSVRRLSVENIVCTFNNIIKFFFRFTILHLLLGAITIYTYYKDWILAIVGELKLLIVESTITTSQFLDAFEMISIICVLGYIALDIKHKANGYSDLRVERFKELVKLEEKLLDILSGIIYLLEKNIEVITERKSFILQHGASELSGKECYIDKKEIKFFERSRYTYWSSEDSMRHISDLDDMEDEFQKLAELEKEFKKSGLGYSNIYLVDHKAMLTRLIHFWSPGFDNKEYMKMEFFCRSSMEKWYKNRFMIRAKDDNYEEKHYSESQTRDRILEASGMLDYELERALYLELYLKKYERKMIERFKKINKFSRFYI